MAGYDKIFPFRFDGEKLMGCKILEKCGNKMLANHIARSAGELVQRRIDHLAIGQKMQDLPEELWHKSFRYYVKEDPNRKGGPNLRMIRLDPHKPSPTVTGFIFNKFVHPFENRFVTVREAARLQGFPDNVVFSGTLTSTQQQVGNAVPVPLAKAVFQSVLQSSSEYSFNSEKLKGFSLFSGAGGMDIGAEQATYKNLKIDTRIALDNWKDAYNTLRGYYGEKVKVLNQDISSVDDPLQLWKDLSGTQERPDIVYGGPPCQSFSQAGKQKGNLDERGQLIAEFLRFVRALAPSFFVMENVSNLKGVGGGTLYHQIVDQMNALDYNVTVGVLLSADYGAPQMRRRLIFLGCRRDIGSLPLPIPQYHEQPTLFDSPYTTVQQAFENLPDAVYSYDIVSRTNRSKKEELADSAAV